MKDVCQKFHRILLVELDDLEEDLDLFVSVMETRHASGEITDYVYNENLAIVRNEVLGVRDCVRGCEEIESAARGSVGEVAAELKRRLRKRMMDHGYVPALYALIDKRIDKIAAYLAMELGDERAARTGGAPRTAPGSEVPSAIP